MKPQERLLQTEMTKTAATPVATQNTMDYEL